MTDLTTLLKSNLFFTVTSSRNYYATDANAVGELERLSLWESPPPPPLYGSFQKNLLNRVEY